MIVSPVTPYDPEKHRLLEHEIVRYLRRQTGIKNLILYRHQRTQNWVLAVWVRPRCLLVELMTFKNLRDFDRGRAQAILRWARGNSTRAKEIVRELRGRDLAELRAMEDEARESMNLKKYIARKLNSDHPFWKHPGWMAHLGRAS